jgi:hypothetical protein
MYPDLLTHRPKMQGAQAVPDGCQKGAKRVQNGCSNPPFLGEDFPNAEGVRDSVSFFSSCCDPRCIFVDMPTWVRDAHVLVVFAGVEIAGSYDTKEGQSCPVL